MVLIALLGGIFLGNVDTAVANTATPAIAVDLRASGGELALIISGYVLSYAVLLIPGARLGQRYGYRRSFLGGLAVFIAMSLACGIAPNGPSLITSRILQGGGGAVMVAQVLTGIQLNFTGRKRARALGWYAAVLAGSAVIGQAAGGIIISADLFGETWRPVFLVNVPLGAVAFALAARFIPSNDGTMRFARIDMKGVVILSAALFAFVLPLVLGHEVGWPDWVWVSFAASVLLFIAFAAWERKVLCSDTPPLIDTRLLKQQAVFWSLCSGALSTGAYYAVLFTLALYLQRGLGYSAAVSGSSLIPWVALFGASGPVLGRLSQRVRQTAAPIGGALLSSSFLAIGITLLTPHTGLDVLIACLGLGGLGYGAVFTGALDQLTRGVSSGHAAEISGLFNTATKVGGVIGVAAISVVYFSIAPSGGGPGAIRAFSVTVLCLSGLSVAAAASAYLAIHSRTATARET